MLPALSQNRNKTNYSIPLYLRPIITSVDSEVAPTTGTGINISGDVELDATDLTLDSLTANTATIGQLTSSQISTFNLVTTFISNFTVASGDDVRFIGTDNSRDFFWDSSRDTLYVEKFKTNNCFTYLSVNKDEDELTGSDALEDKGIVFQWFDNTVDVENKFGFFGFKSSSERFYFNPNISITNDCNVIGITETYGDMELNDVYLRNIINENISNNLGITSVSDINIDATSDITFNAGGNLSSTIGNNYNIGVTGDYTLDITNGIFDILVNGDASDSMTIENTNGSIEILTNSSNSNAINIHSQGSGVNIESGGSGNITLQTANNISMNTDGGTIATITDSNGFSINVDKTDYLQWIPYYNFDAYSGIWVNNRTIVGSSPLYGLLKDVANESAIIYSDTIISSRTTTDKGYKLKSVFFAYKITTQDITSITPKITLKTYDSSTPSGSVTLTNIPFTDNNLSSGTNTAEHYRSIDITTPFFINDESIINIEIDINTQALSVFEFYGCHLSFDRNHT